MRTDEPCPLRPFDPAEAARLKEAAQQAGVTPETMRLWCAKYHLGRQIGERWRVSRVALLAYQEGREKTLERYLAGDRKSPDVVQLYERLDLTPPPEIATPIREGAI